MALCFLVGKIYNVNPQQMALTHIRDGMTEIMSFLKSGPPLQSHHYDH